MTTKPVDDSDVLEMVPDTPQWALLFRRVFCGGIGGVLAGILFLGIGSRIVMRVVALLNPEAKGTLTDAEQIVSAITPGGTFALWFSSADSEGYLRDGLLAFSGLHLVGESTENL